MKEPILKTFSVKEVCKPCNGTGLYSGEGERDGAVVVCYLCDGTGCHNFTHTYEVFTKRKIQPEVKRVYRSNPAYVIIGNNDNVKFEDFGGIPYEDWQKDGKFPIGSEMRKYTCPNCWNQCTDENKEPSKEWCTGLVGTVFTKCPSFPNKAKCWESWDEQFGHNNVQPIE